MTEEEWRDPEARCLGMFLAGQGLDESDQRGRKLGDENFLVLLNAHHEDMAFTLPTFHPGSRWVAWMDTSHEDGLRTAATHDSGGVYPLQARSLVVLMERRLMERKNEKKEESNEAPS
jgi:isoamylase